MVNSISAKIQFNISEMRAWLADLEWLDDSGFDIESLKGVEVLHLIKRHYDGGIAGFIKDMGLTD